eukprot:12832026-Alexandrium_andersonii.AAC.1
MARRRQSFPPLSLASAVGSCRQGPPAGRTTTVGLALAFASWRPPFVPTLRFAVALRPHQGPLAVQGAPPCRHDRIT